MSGPDPQRRRRPGSRSSEQSLARIEQGGIPLSAERRLRELRRAGGAGTFTSDLSVNGFALCHQLGLKPLSQVMGSSIYQMGYQGSWGNMGYGNAILIELDTLSEALNEVRGRALVRLAEEARHVGADAVVGVQTRAGESQLETGHARARARRLRHRRATRRRARRAPRADRAVGGGVRDARAAAASSRSGSSRGAPCSSPSYVYGGMMGEPAAR